VNLYPVNGAVLVPTIGHIADRDALDLIGDAYPGREVVAVPGAVLAYGGGGVHCITQQVPAP
jgi:agmatine deiminase